MISPKKSALIAVVVVATLLATAEGQSSTPDCASKLTPCFSFLNSTNPPPSCCNPLREAVTNDLKCLCNLYGTPGLLPSLGVNVTQALRLPMYCKINGDLSACKAASAPGPASSVPSPPGVAGGNEGNGVGKVSWTGLSTLTFAISLSAMLC